MPKEKDARFFSVASVAFTGELQAWPSQSCLVGAPTARTGLLQIHLYTQYPFLCNFVQHCPKEYNIICDYFNFFLHFSIAFRICITNFISIAHIF